MKILEEGLAGKGNVLVKYAIVEEIPEKLYHVVCPSIHFFEYCRDLNQCRNIANTLSEKVKDFLYV